MSASDGSSGAIIAFRACHAGGYHIIVQHVDSLGVVLWGNDGIDVCTAKGDRQYPQITSDGAGGVIVTWMDYRSGNYDIYTQRVNASGAVQWTTNGVPLCTATGNQEDPQITSDGAGGAIVSWSDARSGNPDIYAQRVDASGAVQWTANGVALCPATEHQRYPAIVSDGTGGAIVIWWDLRSGTNYDIYAQRVNASGAVQWTPDGVALCTATGDQYSPTIVSDGAGGAIVTWYDYRSGITDIYAQRVNASGAVQWTANGIALCTAMGTQNYPQITSDGAGGAIVTWRDYRSGTNYDIYAQRVNASGAAQWTANGVGLCTATGDHYSAPAITFDGAGGAIVTWRDHRSENEGIYAQRVNASGAVHWTANGVSLCTTTGDQYSPTIISGGAGGAIVMWKDDRSGGSSDIYAQRVNALGSIQWTANGVALCAATGTQEYPQSATDGAGGAIVTWQDLRSGDGSDIYAQRVNVSGSIQWTANGIGLCTAAEDQRDPTIVSDGAGGAIIAWADLRNGDYDIYAQRVNASGSMQWTANGVSLCTTTGNQSSPMIISDGAGGAIVTWQDLRSGDNYDDIYAQRVDASGTVQWTTDGVPLCVATGDQGYPKIVSDSAGGAIVTWQDFRGGGGSDIYAQKVNAIGIVQWTLDGIAICSNYWDQRGPTIVSDGAGGAIIAWVDSRNNGNYDIYTQRVNASGAIRWTTDGVPLCTATGEQTDLQITSDGSGGAIVTWQDYSSYNIDIYTQRVDAGGAVQWAIDGVPLCAATGDQVYPQIISDGAAGAIVTWQDARCGSLIYAQRVRGSGEIVSTQLQGYTAAPAPGGIRIDWSLFEMDGGARFSILRASAPEWKFVELEKVAIDKNGLSFTCTDESCLPGSTYKYRVVCEAGGMGPRVLFETDAITIPALPVTLYQNHPNPFNPQTVIRFYLPEAQEIFLDVYDVAGQRVARLAEGRTEKGYHEVTWDGRNSSGTVCSSGVYFSRLKAGKSTVSRKMVIMR